MAKDWGWKRDPTVKGDLSGHVPEGHTRRCQGRVSRSTPPRQCEKWARRGSDYCRTHGKRRQFYRKTVTGFYSKFAGPTLRQRLLELEKLETDQRFDVSEEVDLARVIAERAVRLFEKICLEPTNGNGRVAPPEMKIAATVAARDAMTHVTQVVERAVKLRHMNGAYVSVESIDFVVAQVCGTIAKIVEPKDAELAAELAKAVREIRLPRRSETRAAAQASAQEVREALLAMDDTEGRDA